jgi:CBS domain containing-hemolysin-like protein
MIAQTLISNDIVPLRTSNTGEEALGIMADFYVKHLPIVNHTQLLGVISEDDLLNYDPEDHIGAIDVSMSRLYVKTTDHLYDVMRTMALHQLSIIPVVDAEGNYQGLITLEDLLQAFAAMGSFTEPGSIIVVETSKRGYSLSEIARIVESENASVLSAYISTPMDAATVDVAIKVNAQNINAILATFERFGYEVKAAYREDEYSDVLRERYDSFMAYLNV